MNFIVETSDFSIVNSFLELGGREHSISLNPPLIEFPQTSKAYEVLLQGWQGPGWISRAASSLAWTNSQVELMSVSSDKFPVNERKGQTPNQ